MNKDIKMKVKMERFPYNRGLPEPECIITLEKVKQQSTM
jgi:hypothetical protein